MFTTARIKLTAWYLLMIMVVSLSFSLVIYATVTDDIEERLFAIEHRMRAPVVGPNAEAGHIMQIQNLELLKEDYTNAKKTLLLILLYTNSGILIISAFAGYILAGKTLSPIEESLNEQKRFIADASHELKTPITSLKTSIEVALRDKKLTKQNAIKELNESLKELNKLQRLSVNLLSLANYQKSHDSIDKTSIDISEIVNAAIKNVSSQAKKKNIKIDKKIADGKIKVDSDSIEKLITILLDNAIKYSDSKSKINLIANFKRRNIYITIKDNGMGISKDDLLHIFERFYQSERTKYKSGKSGAGLGLSIAKRIVELHGGHIKVSSKIKSGTTFIVSLPQN